jgi:hypothetical protein
MKIGFTGTKAGLLLPQSEALIELVARLLRAGLDEVHHGDCVGADSEFHAICKRLNIRTVLHPPLDPRFRAFCEADVVHEKKDYLVRNHDIVDATDSMIACPRSTQEEQRSGTWATIRYARKSGKSIRIVYPDGAEI